MAAVHRRKVIRHGISPTAAEVDRENIFVYTFENGKQLIAVHDVFVDILREQFRAQIARAPAHTIYGCVYDNFTFGMHQNKFLRIGKRQLQVVVRMKTDPYTVAEVVVYKVIHPEQIVFIHGAQSIDQIKRERAQPVHLFDEGEQRRVRVIRGAHGLKKHFIPLFFRDPFRRFSKIRIPRFRCLHPANFLRLPPCSLCRRQNR